MTLFDVILEDAPATARFRFLTPSIGGADGAASFSDVAGDMQYLCDRIAIPALSRNGWTSGDIVISFSAQAIEFGAFAPEVRQYFQPFSIQDAKCLWEEF